MLTEGFLYASCTNHIFFNLLIFCYLYFHHLFSRLGTRNDLKNNEEEEEEGIFFYVILLTAIHCTQMYTLGIYWS